MFPDYGKNHYYSILPMCISEYPKQLAIDRLYELEKWLCGENEVGACLGSIKSKDELPAINPFLISLLIIDDNKFIRAVKSIPQI